MPMKMNFPFGGYPQQPTMMGQFGGIGQPMGQPMGQPIGFNINNLNQQMKIPQSFKQWFIFLLKNYSILINEKKINIKFIITLP